MPVFTKVFATPDYDLFLHLQMLILAQDVVVTAMGSRGKAIDRNALCIIIIVSKYYYCLSPSSLLLPPAAPDNDTNNNVVLLLLSFLLIIVLFQA